MFATEYPLIYGLAEFRACQVQLASLAQTGPARHDFMKSEDQISYPFQCILCDGRQGATRGDDIGTQHQLNHRALLGLQRTP